MRFPEDPRYPYVAALDGEINEMVHPLPDPLQCRCVVNLPVRRDDPVFLEDLVFLEDPERIPYRCECGQMAMDGYLFCADCQTTAEVGMRDFKPLRELTSPEQSRPDRVLGDWVMRPCGTIADGKIR